MFLQSVTSIKLHVIPLVTLFNAIIYCHALFDMKKIEKEIGKYLTSKVLLMHGVFTI